MTIRPTESLLAQGIKALDEASVRVLASGEEYYKAVELKDNVGATKSALEQLKGLAEIPNYTSIAVDKITMAVTFASRFIPISVDPTWVRFWTLIPVKDVLGALGVICYTLEILVNSIGIYQGHQVLTVLRQDEKLLKKVENLEKMNFNVLKMSLPLHMREKLEKYGNQDIFQYFKDEIKAGRPGTAEKVVKEIENYIIKKRVVQVLAILSAVFALAASIAMFVACPPLAILVLSAISIALTTARYMLNSGWLENPNAGFNWRLMIPAFLRVGKLYADLSPPPIEMKPMNLIEVRPKTYTPPAYFEEPEDDPELFIDFSKPVEEKVQEKPKKTWREYFNDYVDLFREDSSAEQWIFRFRLGF